jgi:MtN3 and saliva related transmembrane protein
MEIILKNLGLIGSIIFAAAYIPQIVHLVKIKDSTGISISSWMIWLLGAILLLVYAIHLHDIVFLVLTILETAALVTTIVLAAIYKKKI